MIVSIFLALKKLNFELTRDPRNKYSIPFCAKGAEENACHHFKSQYLHYFWVNFENSLFCDYLEVLRTGPIRMGNSFHSME